MPAMAGIGVLVQRLGGMITVVDLVQGGPAHLSGHLRIGQVLNASYTSSVRPHTLVASGFIH
jgi:C-terminal processing protease CtpA/Prc